MPADVVILGCGPSGLAAATAVVNLDRTVLIVSNADRPSKLYGCQYLHAPIPGYETVRHTRVGYYLQGTAEQYRLKVYGENWKGKVSPEDFVGEHDAWDIRATYGYMWSYLHGLPSSKVNFVIVPSIVAGRLPREVYEARSETIISTIPAPALCHQKGHTFNYHTIYAAGTSKPGAEAQDTIVCDGTSEHTWYRNACVFGYRTTEWSKQPTGGERVAAVAKPLATDCTCNPDIYRIGRYGKWLKSYLVHQAYPDVVKILE